MLFISYSRQDSGRIGSVTARLKALGLEYWLDTAEIPVGEALPVPYRRISRWRPDR
jgi:hypothetical protein